jgi:two-component system, sensor histidine kinase and response regulator
MENTTMTHNPDNRVLIVEDDPLVGEMVQGLMEEIGYAVAGTAGDGHSALKLAQSVRPDVIIMDIKLPDIDGIETTRLIQDCCPTPVVVLTAYQVPQLVAQASAAGVGAYLIKPPSAFELERAITIARARFEDMMALRRLNADLKARNEELDMFAQTVAHDLKSPLGLIISQTEVLRNYDDLSQDDQLQVIRSIARNGRKMDSIIDGLLLLARLRNTEVRLEPIDMARVVAEARRQLAHLIQESKARISLPEAWPAALGHELLIEEVWVNYLSNGLKYGGEPPQLELGATPTPEGTVRFWVKDSGPGLSAEEQARLFTPFTQLNQVDTTGHGLGLSIVRHIVEKLGGEVGVESSPGLGSTFSFALPASVGPERGEPRAGDI